MAPKSRQYLRVQLNNYLTLLLVPYRLEAGFVYLPFPYMNAVILLMSP